MNNHSIAAAAALALAAGSGIPLPRFSTGGTRKVYAEDRAKIEENSATAGERIRWNEAVEQVKAQKVTANYRTFVPRKASHKQGWRRPEVQPF